MSRPEKVQVEEHLRRAVSAIPSNHAEEIWQTPVEKADADAWFLDGTEKGKSGMARYMRWASLAAACFAIVLLGWVQFYRLPDVRVYLDVNPSVSLDVSRLGKVIRVQADNEDGEIILDHMILAGTDVDVAVNALLGSMVRHGYLSELQNTLLISVDGRNEARTAALRQKLSDSAVQAMTALLGKSILLEQTVDPDDDAEEIAEKYGITPGKAVLIRRLMQDQPEWQLQDLAAMPVADLIRYCRNAGIDILRYLGEDGEVIGDLEDLTDDDDPDEIFDDWDDDDRVDAAPVLKKPAASDDDGDDVNDDSTDDADDVYDDDAYDADDAYDDAADDADDDADDAYDDAYDDDADDADDDDND